MRAPCRHSPDGQLGDLERFRPQRHLEAAGSPALWPFGGGERVCLGKPLAELEIRLLAVGVLGRVSFELLPDQNLELAVIPSPMPRDGLLVRAVARSGEAAPEHGTGPEQHQGGGHQAAASLGLP